jgi:hypothetical protein
VIRTLDLALLGSAAVVIGGLLTAALYLATGRVRSAGGRAIDLLRVAVLILIALFVWLRPGVRPSGAPGLAYYVTFAAGLPAIIAFAWRSARLRTYAERALDRAGFRTAVALTSLSILLAVPMAVTPVALHWDVPGWMDSRSYDAFALNIVNGKIPEGNSAYMPVYQYGMAFVYYVAGHFFFAQQAVNVVLALTGVAALCLTAWLLFQSSAAVLATGILAAYSKPLFYAVHFTQIETWYTPIVCVLVLAWAAYWRRPSLARVAALALMIGIAVNTRNQGALFFAFLGTTPLLMIELAWRHRLAHAALGGLIVTLCLVPWTLRNYGVEGRLSPFASRSAMYVGILSDPRIGLYGIRYWEGWEEVASEYAARYPDPTEREQAYLRAAWTNMVRDPARSARAMVWRAGAFYGLLPDGMLDPSRVTLPDWRSEWKRYVYWRTVPLLLVPLSFLVIAVTRGSTMWFLAGAIAANVMIVTFAASSEDRISYPVLPLHILICAGLFAGRAPAPPSEAPKTSPARFMRWRSYGIAIVVVGLFLAAGRTVMGSRFVHRPLMEGALSLNPALVIDQSIPLLTAANVREARSGSPAFHIGDRVRVRCMVTNYMYPPKHVGPVPEVPAFASDPEGDVYFFAYLLVEDRPPVLTGTIGVTFHGAQQRELVREGDAVEIEGEIVYGATQGDTSFWLRAERVQRLPLPPAELPPFP